MWLNIKWYDASGALIAEDGEYGEIGVTVDGVDVRSLLDLDSTNTRIYEAHMGLTREWASQLIDLGYSSDLALSYDRLSGAVDCTLGNLAQGDGQGNALPPCEGNPDYQETFHFVLNNTVVKDNRIPPYGMSYELARVRNALPVPADQYSGAPGGTYDYFDEVTLSPPAGAQSADISLMYQPTSWEYIQFLYLANNGTDPAQGGNEFLGEEGINILDAWLNTGMAEPYMMASISWGRPDVIEPGAGDVVGTGDLNSDGWGDVAFLTNGDDAIGVEYFSGATRQPIDSTDYLSSVWDGLALARVSDTNGDGVTTDPSMAVLAHNPSTGAHIVQTRRADNGQFIGDISFLNAGWRVLDLAVVDDTNGDGTPSDPSIAVLAVNPVTSKIIVQIRRLADGSLVGNRYYLNPAWAPVAVEAVERNRASPLLSVLAVNAGTGKTLVQARLLSDGSLHRNTVFLNTAWHGRDLAILEDTDGDAGSTDPSYLVLAVNPGTGKNVVQARGVSDGALEKNIFFLNTNWASLRVAGSEDISGNSIEDVGALARNPTTDNVVIQLKDYATVATTGNIFP